MSRDSQSERESGKDLVYEQAFRDAIAVQQDKPKWLNPGDTVIILSERFAFEFEGIDDKGMAVCRRPNPEKVSEYIELSLPQTEVVNAELLKGFYITYKKGGTYIDPYDI